MTGLRQYRLHPDRRRFLRDLALGCAAAGATAWQRALGALGRPDRPGELDGSDFDLVIDRTAVNYTGRPREAITVNGMLPAPLLRWREGDTVTVNVANRLDEDTSIHWHGILLPANMDGVPGLSFAGIPAAGSYRYRFPVRQAGTYWYHSHSAFQEQAGLYGPLVIEPLAPEPFTYDRDYVVLLSEWTDEAGERILDNLKKRSDYYNLQRRTLADFFRDAARDGWRATVGDRLHWGRMRMQPTDLADVTAETYTYLMNGHAAADNWTALFRPGERIRLRFINGSALTYFDVRIPGLRMRVVAADGLPVRPVEVDEFRIAVAETFDVIVEPSGSDAFTLMAQAMDRSGYACGTLAVRAGLRAPVPALDERPLISLADMGHGDEVHGAMGHGSRDNGPTHHSGHAAPALSGPANDDSHAAAAGALTGMPHGAPAAQAHPASEAGNPLVDMQVMAPRARLHDPGIGLRDNGRRVLTYGDLVSLFADPDGREPARTIELHLTGHMERFAWSFDGVPFSAAEPVRLGYGERVRIVLVNDTMMAHPIHLHGMWSDLENEHGEFQLRKHTIDVPPGTRRSYRVTADALGRWAYHCHVLYHMEAGMFREVRVDEADLTRP